MPQSHSQELIPGFTTNPDYESHSFPNEEIDSEIAYTDNPTYESSLPGNGLLQQFPLAAQYIVPVEAKRNERCPGSDITRNVDALHAYLDGSKQNSSIPPSANIGDNLNNEQDTAKHGAHTEEVNTCDECFEATAICHQPAQTVNTNTIETGATRNVPTKPSLPSNKITEKYPYATYV